MRVWEEVEQKKPSSQNCKYLSQFIKKTTFKIPKCFKWTNYSLPWGGGFFPRNTDTCQILELNLNGLNSVSWQPASQESTPLTLEEERAFQYL